MPSPLQLQRNRNQRIDIAKRPDVRKNNAQDEVLTAPAARRYEGNASGAGLERNRSNCVLMRRVQGCRALHPSDEDPPLGWK
jgi:hypothetical protein